LTNVGTSSTRVDSIASFGLDPLQVDSFWISGPRRYEFAVSSQLGSRFTLGGESASKFTVSYTPSRPDSLSQDTLYVRCSNAECDQRLIAIVLTGTGAAPNGSIGPDTLNFGTVRLNYNGIEWANGFNAGKASWIIDSITFAPAVDTAFFSCNLTTFPYPVAPGNEILIRFTFTPKATKSYRATATVWTRDGKRIPILLLGNGATPIFTVFEPALNFDTVLTNSVKVLYDTVRNDGAWPARITRVVLGGPGRQFYSFEDMADTSGFILNAGESRYYVITYHPRFTVDATENAYLEFDFDDASQPKMITLTGFEKRPRITYSTKSVDFGKIEVHTSGYQTVGVQNASGSAVPVYTTFLPNTLVFQLKYGSKFFFSDGVDSLPLAFHPAIHGPASDWMYIACNGQYDSIYLYGFGALPQPVFSPPSLYFGVCFDYDSNYAATRLMDTGDYPLAICDAKIVGPDSSEFSLYPLKHSLPDTLREGGLDTLTFSVNFTTHALAGRDHYATLEVIYCDGTMDTIPLHAKEADQFIQFCSSKIDFGKVRVGTKADTTACFYNGALVPLPVDSIWITRNGLPFSVAQRSGRISASGVFLDSTTFAPMARGVFSGMLHGVGEGMKEDSIVITGSGAQSAALLSSKQIDFGIVPLLITGIPQPLSLRDTGDWALAAKIEKINDPYGEFSVQLVGTNRYIDPIAYDTVPIGGTVYYSITFTPRHPELPDHESELVFNYDDGTVDTVLLIGRDSSDFLAFDRDTIDFGKIRLGAPPVSQPLGLVNTSKSDLTALAINAPSLPFIASRTAPILVKSEDTALLQIQFNPKGIGNFQSSISGKGLPFKSAFRDTVILLGTAAAPIPKLSVDTLDFDTIALGRTVTRSFTLSNRGNWPLLITRSPVTGPNASDFTPVAIPTDTTINDSEQTTYAVTFKGSSPLQLTPRLGLITWTKDDGSTFQLVLRAYDVPPYIVHIGFPHPYWGRPGDKLSVELDLQSSIPDTLAIEHIRGTVTFDPSVVDGPDIVPGGGVQPGSLVQVGGWTPRITYHHGSFDFDLSSTTDTLSKSGTLLNFMLKLHPDLQDGASSPLIGIDTLPDTREALASSARSSIFLDSNCGTIHLLSGGLPSASFIRQNTPNPFGASKPATTVPFDVGTDNTIVTIRLLDPTGREVLRPVDQQSFARGRYEVTIDANALSPGIYFYEFRAGDLTPQMKKMVVE
jgi:hypothetical protein